MNHRKTHARGWMTLVAICCGLSGGLAWAAKPKEPKTALDLKEFFKPELYLSTSDAALETVLSQLPNRARWESFLVQRGEDPAHPRTKAFVDPRSGAVTNLLEAVPLVPGRGEGNTLRTVGTVDAAMVEKALRAHVRARRELLGIDISQLGAARVTSIHDDLWQVSIPQRYRGVVVRDGRLAATISHGNLVLLGTEAWGNVRDLDASPRLSPAQAMDAGFAYAGGRLAADLIVRAPRLEIVPFAPPEFQEGEAFAGAIGQGYGHRLAWSFVFQRVPEEARWEVLVDAHDGEVLAFQDRNQHATKAFTGGVYPLTSTDVCPNADQCGIMQLTWPMPFADTGFAAPDNFTNSAGLYNYTSGTATTTLTGRFVDIADTCGLISNSSPTGDIDLGGAPGQHDCTSGGGSAGNTPASRSAFYEVNKLKEMARGYLPANAWLSGVLTTNVNLTQTCNAFWNGFSINFYRSGGGCRNTGEIAAVFDHEWGHGMDDNDANGFLSNSSEAYADIAANYRLEASCVGHGFWWTLNQGCGTTADGTGFNADEAQVGASHCDLDCSGVRDSDYLKHNPNTPDTPLNFVCPSCLASSGPCGRQVHCAASPVRQAAWDLVARDLTSAPFNMNSQTAFITGNRLFYLGSGNVGLWHACTCGVSSDGCGATHGYMQWLAADDDDGNLNNGTPHMTAIHAAYNRHGIACNVPAPQNGGCAGGPTAASALTATPGDNSVALSWTAVPGATGYWVYRSEGHAGCNFGKAKIADVTTLSFSDNDVANGREYYYNVVAHGASQSCFGPVSNCASVTPQSGPPDFTLSCSPSTLAVPQGGSGNSTCTVASLNSFNDPVTLSCTGLPNGASCSYSPNPVTPPAGGNVNSALTVSVGGGVPTGSYPFQAEGASGPLSHAFGMTLNVTVPGAELLVNGGFEGGCNPWVFTGNGIRCNQSGTNPHTGIGYVELGGRINRSGRTYQEVAIPPAAPANLTFWLSATTSEPGPGANDVMRVEVRNTSNVLLATVATYSNLDAGPYTQKGAFSLAAFAGQTIRLYFRSTNDASLPTTFRLDDVSLQ